jgi:hypothetical protein
MKVETSHGLKKRKPEMGMITDVDIIKTSIVSVILTLAYLRCWNKPRAMRMLGLVLVVVSAVVIPAMYYIIGEGGYPAVLALTIGFWSVIGIMGLITFIVHRKSR